MAKTIWIMNHYATDTFFDRGGRHYYFAKYLLRDGYNVRIICASTVHNSEVNVDTQGELFINNEVDGIPYTFIKTGRYVGNGKSRIKNMVQYYRRSFKTVRQLAATEGKPDVILASSVHPLTLVAGIKIAEKWGIPCICEVRDLWPESLVAYGIISKNNPVTKFLYMMEKWIYKKADKLIFTMAGGQDYIRDNHWDKKIDMTKIFNITNGIDAGQYNDNLKNNTLRDSDLDNIEMYKVIYAGSIREVNKINQLVDVAAFIQGKGIQDIKFIIFGDGDQRKNLEEKCKGSGIRNIVFKGFVEKKFIPSIVSRASINIIEGDAESDQIMKYGLSANKLFEYVEAGKPIICAFDEGKHGIIETNQLGIARRFETPEALYNAIKEIREKSIRVKSADEMRNFAKKYDYKNLTKDLEEIIG